MLGYPEIDIKKTGENIKVLCSLKGLSVKEIQSYLGFSCPQSIYRWYSGKSLPSLDNLYAISCLLQVPIDEILIGARISFQFVIYEMPAPYNNALRCFMPSPYSDRIKPARYCYTELKGFQVRLIS